MSVSPILEIQVLSESQAQKATAINMALQAMEQALAASLTLDNVAGRLVGSLPGGSGMFLPYDPTNDLTLRPALRFIKLTLEGTVAYDYFVYHPERPHMFIVTNNTTQIAKFRVWDFSEGEGTGSIVSVPVGSTWLLYCNGSSFERLEFTVNTLRAPQDFAFSYWGKPGPDALIGQVLVPRDCEIPANFAGSIGKSGEPPAIPRVFTVYDGGISFGTITLGIYNDFTFASAGGTARSFSAGDIIKVVNSSATTDVDLEDVQFNILAWADIPQ